MYYITKSFPVSVKASLFINEIYCYAKACLESCLFQYSIILTLSFVHVGGNNVENRRESIEGEPEEIEISNLVNSVRDLTVGENPTDIPVSTSGIPESTRKTSRQESSDSDREQRGVSPRDRRDHRYHERDERGGKGKPRERYSPDNYNRDKKYERRRYKDRRYDDDTDYYSEKERERKNREEYERKYSSLRRDKDKDRRRKDGREGRRDHYYGRYEDEYENNTR